MMTREEIFDAAVQGGFAAGPFLPDESGDVARFHVIRLTAQPGDTIHRILGRVLESAHIHPRHSGGERSRQCRDHFRWVAQSGQRVILLFDEAHHLTPRLLESLRSVHEWGKFGTDIDFPHVGVVLLGDMRPLFEGVESEPSVRYRTTRIPGLRLLRFGD